MKEEDKGMTTGGGVDGRRMLACQCMGGGCEAVDRGRARAKEVLAWWRMKKGGGDYGEDSG